MNDHTFVIPAYGESPYLEICIRSLLEQTIASDILIVTSTENEAIHHLAYEYGIPVYVHDESGIGSDWNFGLSCATTNFITIAHQDDVYLKHYLEKMLSMFENHPDGIIAFSNYREIRDGWFVAPNRNIKIKEAMLRPIAAAPGNKIIRRRILGLGNPICCPSVTYNRRKTGDIVFNTAMGTNIDWKLWEELSKKDGDFLYTGRVLMGHRIHSGSATTDTINQHVRSAEDLQMLSEFWPKPVAKLIEKIYQFGEKANS